ncbi:hypothetical protein VDG1235_783 [Verrucomicrobiia bacterium DG1235]|nr:hypothetical protein VDG1235_783 [Verrucomicrobiae bacterium DG1235]
MDEKFKETFEQAAAMQKTWMDTITGVANAWSQYSPENPPPDELKKMRKGILDVISASWEDFMRTPQFMEIMRDTLNNSMAWQSYTKDNVNRMHDVTQTASKQDVDSLLLAIRHIEKRLLDRVEGLQDDLAEMREQAKQPQGQANKTSKEDLAFQKVVVSRLGAVEQAIEKLASTVAKPATAKPVAKPAPSKTTKSPAKSATPKSATTKKTAKKTTRRP